MVPGSRLSWLSFIGCPDSPHLPDLYLHHVAVVILCGQKMAGASLCAPSHRHTGNDRWCLHIDFLSFFLTKEETHCQNSKGEVLCFQPTWCKLSPSRVGKRRDMPPGEQSNCICLSDIQFTWNSGGSSQSHAKSFHLLSQRK